VAPKSIQGRGIEKQFQAEKSDMLSFLYDMHRANGARGLFLTRTPATRLSSSPSQHANACLPILDKTYLQRKYDCGIELELIYA
jgi:hypothetical protein